MKLIKLKTIGVMSGTSLDGIDLAEITFTKTNSWQFEIGATQTLPYPDDWFTTLKSISLLSKEEVDSIDEKYSEYLGSVIRSFLDKNQVSDIDLIASHGHTVWHRPDEGRTLQIGNRPALKKALGLDLPVICDFRVQDVKLGGQGAPLVPIGDRLLFGDYDYCMNLGGFSNISYEENNQRIAFDICPVNTVLNHYAEKFDLPFDEDGKIAKEGDVNIELLHQLNQLSFYQLSPPKSLGIEFVQTEIFPLIENRMITIPDVLATFSQHIAQQIAAVIKNKNSSLLITGGGTFNKFLIECIQDKLPMTKITLPGAKLINYKEALIFALLGVLKLNNKINVLSSVTGASRDHSSGVLY